MQDLVETAPQEEKAAGAELFSLAESSKSWRKILEERNKDPDAAG
jgi:hypothetical protein